MNFVKKEKLSQSIKYYFQFSYREDFINNSLRILCNQENKIQKIEMESSDYGIAYWEKDKGQTFCRSWEDEDQVSEFSPLSKHYPSFFLNGLRGEDFADKIFEDCLDKITDLSLKQLLKDFKEHPEKEFYYKY